MFVTLNLIQGLLYEKIASALKRLEYIPRGDRDLDKEIMRNLKHLIGRSGLTEWELNMIYGICARIEKKLKNVVLKESKR
jgi:tRNA C32,U32 (ribose-2'-O)-methylase TrmJ